jgi:hypothetical protein
VIAHARLAASLGDHHPDDLLASCRDLPLAAVLPLAAG